MQKTLLCLALIYLSTSNVRANANHPCGDNTWNTYKDEKCFKLFKSLETRDSAEDVCKQQYSTLVMIKSAAEQTFLIEYVFNSSKSNNVWIGAKRRLDSSTEFVWNDGSPVDGFTNWAIGRPSNVVSRTCVLLQSLFSRNINQMEWTDAACSNGFWFICEKLQVWHFEQLQQAILSNRRELQQAIENPVPIGFIYVQLPHQPEPQNLWGKVNWIEITSEYAGLFFRAQGGGSAEFESIQLDNSPRLTDVRHAWVQMPGVAVITVNANGVASPAISSGAASSITHWGLTFTVSSGEVRPRNTAMRIWKRI